MTDMLDLRPAASELARIAHGITDDQLAAPTPCPDTSVEALLGHVIGLSQAFQGAAVKAPDKAPDGPQIAADGLEPDWRTVLPRELEALVTAWHDPAAWEGTTSVGGFESSGAELAGVANDELVLHAWDLAVATGQPFDVDPANLEACHAFVSSIPDVPEARRGLFGPRVEVPADAPLLDRVLGLAGRDPGWGPPA